VTVAKNGDRGAGEAFTGRAYGETLLRGLQTPLGTHSLQLSAGPLSNLDLHPALAWARSGAMALTGHKELAPLMCPVPLASCADGVVGVLETVSAVPLSRMLSGAALLGERAALGHLQRAGPIAPGGSCRLLQTRDGRIAVNLSRPDDWSAVPAWLGETVEPDWDPIACAVAGRGVDELIDRGRLLGLAVSADRLPRPGTRSWHSVTYEADHAARQVRCGRVAGSPLVVDLSSLWAGPLCGHILTMLGARVLKVESVGRPDGTRAGARGFHDLLNCGKESVALEFGSPQGRDRLRRLLARADIVIEASRPRALQQLGIDAVEIIAASPALTWISITGYGRGSPEAAWVAFGDDAGVASGLSSILAAASGYTVFCSDAIADPLTGLHAALAAWCSFLRGGSRLISIALHDVMAYCIGFAALDVDVGIRERFRLWCNALEVARCPVLPPSARQPSGGNARALGGDTTAVLRELSIA
jgi:crotonobetainyl-CoA:carnitine CoA-transferase CaiB-like acyl-CoA transferase